MNGDFAGFAQGLINFFNNANTLVSVGSDTVQSVPTTGPVGAYYFALLTAPTNSSTFTFSGIYGTNQAVAGRFNGGANIQVSGWAPGATMQFEVFGWSQNLGPTFNPGWLTTGPFVAASWYAGTSAIGAGMAGGFNGTGTLPSLNIFGGATGIQSGFLLFGETPEPSATTLVGAGVAVLLIFHRKVRCNGAHKAKSQAVGPQ